MKGYTSHQQHSNLSVRSLIPGTLSVFLSGLLLVSTQVIADAKLTELGTLSGSTSEAMGVSGDGSVVVGLSDARAFRWTEAGGMVSLGSLEGALFTFGSAISADGNVITGYGTVNGGSNIEAFRWTSSGMTGLGFLTGGTDSYALGVNSDGSVVVGYGDSASFSQEAFRWTQAGGMVGLGVVTGQTGSRANAVSNDGSVVVGESGTKAFRWTQAGGMVDLGNLGIGITSAYGVNADGSVVVGSGYNGSFQTEAFRWTQAGGMVGLGDLAGGSFFSRAYAVSDDGSVVVGNSTSATGQEAFRWTQTDSMISVSQWLTNNGVTVAGAYPESANATNADGSIVVGQLSNSEAYLACVSSSCSGLITVNDVSDSLGDTAGGVAGTLRTSSMMVNGAHSHPMSHRVAEGQKIYWVAGDWGRDEHGSHDGSIGLAEISGGHNFGPVQVNVSLGKSWTDQNLSLNGDIDADSNYVMVEGILPLSEEKGVYATIGAFHNWGEVEIRRGYLNAGSPDSSEGSADSRTLGLRARVDWENAYSVNSVLMSPYADLSFTDTHLDSYTETGGGFPAYFDSRDDEVTELRIGVNAAMPLSTSSVQLVANLEGAHRFEDKGANVSGQIQGLFSFNLEGEEYDDTWIKAGLGVEGALGKGKASLMLNGTTEGELPMAWLAASYQRTF